MRWSPAALAIAALLAGSTRAGGDEGDRPAQATRTAARAEFEHGRAFQEAGNYRAAVRAYQRAHDLIPDPALLFNIARCHHLRGDAAAALAHYRRFIAEAPPDAPLDEAREYIAELEREASLRAERRRALTARPREPAPEAERPAHGHRALWLGVAAATLVGVGLLLDTAPTSSQNDSLEAGDFVPVGLYAAGIGVGVAAVF